MKTALQNPMGCSKAVLRGMFTVKETYFKKQEKSQMNILTYHLRKLETGEQTKPKVSRKKEIIKIREEIHKILKKKKTSMKLRAVFFEKINKIDKHLAKLTKKKREKTQIKYEVKENK